MCLNVILCHALIHRKMLNKPSKSLAEREAAYAEARLRILGAPKHDDDKEPAASTSEQDRYDVHNIYTFMTGDKDYRVFMQNYIFRL